MYKPKITLPFLLAGMMLQTSCAGGAVSSLIKWRDDGKNMAIVCKLDISEAGMKTEQAYDMQSKNYYNIQVYQGTWSEAEKKEVQRVADNECQKIVKMVKGSIKYNNADLVDLKKVPEAEQDLFGKKFRYPDFSQTKYDYVLYVNAAANKKAKADTCVTSPYEKSCPIVSTSLNFSYMADDWSKKDPKAARSVPFQDPMYAGCSAGKKLMDKVTVSQVTDADFNVMDSSITSRCEAETAKKLEAFQKEIEKASEKKS